MQDVKEPSGEIEEADILSGLKVGGSLLHIGHLPIGGLGRKTQPLFEGVGLFQQDKGGHRGQQNQKADEGTLHPENAPVKRRGSQCDEKSLPDQKAVLHLGFVPVKRIIDRIGLLVEFPAFRCLVVNGESFIHKYLVVNVLEGAVHDPQIAVKPCLGRTRRNKHKNQEDKASEIGGELPSFLQSLQDQLGKPGIEQREEHAKRKSDHEECGG